MLDTCICSFIMREQPLAVLQRLQAAVEKQHRIVISAITYAEMRYGTFGKKLSPKHTVLVEASLERLDALLPWDMAAVDAVVSVKKKLTQAGMLIGGNDIAIAGACILVTNNIREFKRVEGLVYEDWAI